VSELWLGEGNVDVSMRVINKRPIDAFGRNHADVRSQLASWLCEVSDATWRTPCDIKRRYPHASFVGEGGVVFNLKGGKYRLHVKVAYNTQTVFVVRLGTHAQYSRWRF
jgi:mRNA interferase HigB